MATPVEFVQEINGQEQVVETKLPSTEVSIKIPNGNGTDLFTPALTEDISMENSANTSEPKDQCGNTQRARTTNEGWVITVKGIVTDEPREGNLTKGLLRDEVAPRDMIEIRSDLINGSFVLSNTKISKASALDSIQTKGSNGTESAYEFQLQLGEESSQ